MDSIHEAHLSRILEARRRRGVLGDYTDPVTAPLPPRAAYRDPSPPPPLPPFPPQPVFSTAGAQTVEERNVTAAVQTKSLGGSSGTAASAQPVASPANGTSQTSSGWRQSVPRNGGGNASVGTAALMTPQNPNATLDDAVRFESPGRVPSLVYSSPASSSPRRSTPWRPPASAAPPARASPPGTENARRSIEPLPPPLYIPRARSARREPLFQPPSFTPHSNRWVASTEPALNGGFNWRPTSSPSRSVFDDNVAPFKSSWRNRSERDHIHSFSSNFNFTPLSIYREESAGVPLMPWPETQGGCVSAQRQQPLRHRSRRHHRHHRRRESDSGDEHGNDVDGGDRYEDVEVDFAPRRRHSQAGRRSLEGCRRRSPSTCAARSREDDPRGGRGYPAPVVYMGDADDRRVSSSSAAVTSRRRRSLSPGSRRRSRNGPTPRPAEEQRKSALGLPDARSTMDLRTSIETLRAGDWFYKWSAKGDVVHRRWVWVDTKSYLLVWSSRETRNAHFCGDIRLDHICQVTSRDLMSVDEDGFPKTYYVLLIETTKRVLQLATELKDKCDAWFEALNNVMGFIHRNDIAKGALMPD